ncbi:late competence development ComFB family protein [Desulfotruncus alcoholivorax]|uniref:late competence development ComFB family protein n=1 Tax=Desulfotruncus alcoholivorax TaxID=265477 RepID=UPI000415E642|nr:late competence development ComFB family protein [Desulfotruncus alcoholivorax]
MKIVNYTELAVKNILNELFETFSSKPNYCDCQLCKSRAAAMALNDLRPSYVASEAELMAAKASFHSPSENAALVAIVMDAIRKVLNDPKHDYKPLD